MKKKLLLVMCLMVAIATTQAQVEVTSSAKSSLKKLRTMVDLVVFTKLTSKVIPAMDTRKECEKFVTIGMCNLFRTDLLEWEKVQKENAAKATHKKYLLKIDGAINDTITESDLALRVASAYKESFGKFTKKLVKERKGKTYTDLQKDEALKKYLKKPIRLLTKLAYKDIDKKMDRRRKF